MRLDRVGLDRYLDARKPDHVLDLNPVGEDFTPSDRQHERELSSAAWNNYLVPVQVERLPPSLEMSTLNFLLEDQFEHTAVLHFPEQWQLVHAHESLAVSHDNRQIRLFLDVGEDVRYFH